MAFGDAQANRLRRLYADAEMDILRQLNAALLKPGTAEYLRGMEANVDAILSSLSAGNREWCEQAIPNVYSFGVHDADKMIQKAHFRTSAGFGAIHQQAVSVLAENTYRRLEDVTDFIGRRTSDIYRSLALEAIRAPVVGYDTWKKAAKNYKEQLAKQGVTGFQDKTGRQWNMSTYAEMVARTSTMECQLKGTANRLLEQNFDLVLISTHAGACELCQPWQGQVLSLTGKTPGYTTLDEATAAGLFHPNCRHAFGLWISEEDIDKEIQEMEEDKQQEKEQKKQEREEKKKQQLAGAPPVAKPALAAKAKPAVVENFRRLGGGASSTYLGEIEGTKYVFKADEPVAALDMLRGNLEAELLASKVLNHLGVRAPATDYGEYDVGGSAPRKMMQMEFIPGGEAGGQFWNRMTGKYLGNADAIVQQIDIDAFRRIQMIDVLIGNGDRHDGNYFIMKDGSIIPIDHNLAFATDMVIHPRTDWQKNFTPSLSTQNPTGSSRLTFFCRSELGRAVYHRTTKDEYAQIAKEIQKSLTDADIDRMVDSLPAGLVDKARAKELKANLRSRRDELASAMK